MSLVAFIIGAGPHIGAAVGTLLKQNGYRIALGSRNPKIDETKAGFYPVKVDASSPESIQAAFQTVNAELGPPNVVIYNAASFHPLPTPEDPLSLPLESLQSSTAVGLGVFAAAQQAIAGFRSGVHKDAPKAFIVTGNLLPFIAALPSYTSLDIQKVVSARLVETFATAYKNDIRFYFASLVSPSGEIPEDFPKSADTHAQVYWDLINGGTQGNWDHRFTLDGKKLPGYEKP
jgi:NAD(P)-dependent dehydrogenase (short-subunit alcohol dehydrogenase family)